MKSVEQKKNNQPVKRPEWVDKLIKDSPTIGEFMASQRNKRSERIGE